MSTEKSKVKKMTAGGAGRKARPVPDELLARMDAYFRAANYLSAAQLYLLENPLLKEPLTMEMIKKKIVGHWGTVPGHNFIYTHLNRIIKQYDLNMIFLSGPGHGGNFMIANTWLEGTYSEVYPQISRDVDGMQKIEPAYVNLVRSYGGSWLQVYTQVKIPYALPALFSGLKVAATYSVSGAVVGEWVASSEGIGYYLIKAKNSYALDKMFACVLIIIVLSLLMNGLIRLLQWLCLPYTHKKRGGTK